MRERYKKVQTCICDYVALTIESVKLNLHNYLGIRFGLGREGLQKIRTDMLRSLSGIYETSYNEELGNQAAKYADLLVYRRFIWRVLFWPMNPLIDLFLCAPKRVILIEGSVCYALGMAYCAHIESGSQTIDEDSFQKIISDHLRAGEKRTRLMMKDVYGIKPDK